MAIDSTLSQINPTATVVTDLYEVPVAKRTSMYVVVTNRGSSATYRISTALAGAADNTVQYVVYDHAVSTVPQATRRMALPAGTVVRVYASSGDVNFCANGIEQDV